MARVVKQSAPEPGVLRQEITLPSASRDDHEPIEARAAAAETPDTDFWAKVAAVTENDWRDDTSLYLYRTRPGAAVGQDGAYIYRFDSPVDLAMIAEKYGGYDYRATLRSRKRGTIYSRTRFSIDAPPKEIAPATPPATSEQTTANRLVENLIERQGRLENMLTQNPNDSGLKAKLEEVKLIVDTFRSDSPKPSSTTELATVMKTLSEISRPPSGGLGDDIVKALLMKMIDRLDNPAPAGAGLLAQAKELKEALELLGGGKTSSRRSWPDVVGDAIQVMPDILQRGTEALRTVQSMARPAPGARAAAAPGYAPAPAAIGPARRAPAAAAPPIELQPIEPAAPVAPGPAPAPEAGVPREIPGPSIEYVMATVVRMIRQRSTGSQIVAFVEPMFPQIVEQMSQASRAELENIFRTTPILNEAAELPRFKKTLDEIIECFADEGEGDGEPEETEEDAEGAVRTN
jgi:hypothetical protein